MPSPFWDDGVTDWDELGIYWDSFNPSPAGGVNRFARLPINPNTIYFPFVPSVTSNFQFQPTFDGQTYNVILTWNLYGQRYFVNIYTLQNQLIVSLALIGSPAFYNISMTAGYFATMLVFRTSSQTFEVIG